MNTSTNKGYEVKEYYKEIYGPELKPGFKGPKQSKDEYSDYRVIFADDLWDISAALQSEESHLN